MTEPTEIAIHGESIRLGQLLKLSGLVDDGGTARAVLDDGAVTVDGEVETRRGAQIRPGQVVRWQDEALRVVAEPPEVAGEAGARPPGDTKSWPVGRVKVNIARNG